MSSPSLLVSVGLASIRAEFSFAAGLETETQYVGYCMSLTSKNCQELMKSVGMLWYFLRPYMFLLKVSEHLCDSCCCTNHSLAWVLSVLFYFLYSSGLFLFPVCLYVVRSITVLLGPASIVFMLI